MSMSIDTATIQRVGSLAKLLGKSKKTILEDAIRYYSEKVESQRTLDVLSHTFWAWQREESVQETIRRIKETMRRAQERYKK